jgi:hypothetical protein
LAIDRGHYPIPTLGVELGIWQGKVDNQTLPWLRWWDSNGDLLLTGEERADVEKLAEALCKLEGFTYAPSDTFYWQQGYSTESDFLYVTTQTLKHEQLAQLAEEVGTERTLLVLCSAFRGKTDQFPNLTIRKIPKQILDRIYNKLIADFTPNTPKYVFKGISEFAIDFPEIITGDNYEKSASTLPGLFKCKINIFNISKINSTHHRHQ